LLLPLYYQQIRGQSALDAGLLLAPQGVGMLLTRSKAGTLTDRIGARPIVIAGVLLTAIGTIAYTQVGVHTNEILLGLSLVVRGAGLGAVTIPVMAAAYLGLAPSQVPHSSTVTRISQQIGGAFGTAILAMILTTQLHAHGLRHRVLVVTRLHGYRHHPRPGTTPAAQRPARRQQPSVRARQADTPGSTDRA